jgi:hypothetical protein
MAAAELTTSSAIPEERPDGSGGKDDGVVGCLHFILACLRLLDDDDDDDEEEEDDDDDDDDDDELEVDDQDDVVRDNTKEAVSIIKELAEARGKQTKKVAPSTKAAAAAAATKSTESAIRQQCVASLRHLCHQGLISSRQKHILLTDIVSCTAKGEKSKIEVAYELLLSGDNKNDQNGAADGDMDQRAMAQEEFADQCRLFAESQGLDSLR